jgi:wyosine [tRNA(Phe)-imidazoG37] synthetase (radical SAM superfamily)
MAGKNHARLWRKSFQPSILKRRGNGSNMSSQIDDIAEKLIGEKRDVILYGAGTDAVCILSELKHRYSVLPTCICDSDKRKWHKSLFGMKIISIDEALFAYPDAYFFISTNLYKCQIIGQLLTGGMVSKEQILNYEPIERRKSCVHLESQLVVTNHRLQFCCSDFGKNNSPYIDFNGDYFASVDDFICLRDNLIHDLNNSIPTACDGCPCISESHFANNKKIKMLVYGENGVCNFNCSYCNSSAKGNKTIASDINLPKLVNVMRSQNLLDEDANTNMAAGEISIHPQREEIYDAIEDLHNIFCSNSAIYDDRISKLIRNGKNILNVSVDAGTRDTFKKVKGLDLFEKVRTNLHRYAQDGNGGLVELKYIFLPGVNDNEADVDGFVELCKSIDACSVQISYDLHAPGYLTDQTSNMVTRLINKLTKNNFVYKIISDVINKSVNGESGS